LIEASQTPWIMSILPRLLRRRASIWLREHRLLAERTHFDS
jgi:hypothetical protein